MVCRESGWNFRMETASAHAKVPLMTTYLFENMMGSSYLGKGMRFLQRHGVRKFVSRTAEVMKQKANPQGDYGKYRLAVMPTPQELNRQRKETWDDMPLFPLWYLCIRRR